MTRRTSATIAGVTYLTYIAAAFPSMVLFSRATRGDAAPAQLASIAPHVAEMRLTILLGALSAFCAVVLAVTLYSITRDEDRDLALLGFACRLGEGLVGFVPFTTLGLLWLATGTGQSAPDAASAGTLATFLLKVGAWQTTSAALLFAVGSTIFCFLLLRGRMIPMALAWLGVIGSGLLVFTLPLQLAELTGPPPGLIWIPIAVFEITVALWFIIKGVAPARNGAA